MSEINDHEGGSRSGLDTNSTSGTGTNWSRKLLTAKRSLIVNIKALITNLRVASASQLSDLVTQFEDIESSVGDFKARAYNIRDPNVSQLLEEVEFYFEKCRKTLDSATRRALDNPNEDEFHDGVELADNVSQDTAPVSTLSTSSKLSASEIEMVHKRIEIEAARDRDRAAAKAAAEAEAAAAAAAAEAKAEADAEARFRIERAKLDAQEELIALSERGSSIASWLKTTPRGGHKLSNGAITKSFLDTQFNRKKETLKGSEVAGSSKPVKPIFALYPENRSDNQADRKRWDYVNDSNCVDFNRRSTKVFDVININEALPRVACNTAQLCESPVEVSEKSVFKEYLDRQGRNEYINLVTQIGYNGHNIACVFYEILFVFYEIILFE